MRRLRFGPSSSNSDEGEESSGNDSEVSVEGSISLGRFLDRKVAIAREAFGSFLALPVAWIQLQPNVEALRRHKTKRVEAGIDLILWIQTFRTPFLDLFMQICSFGAEEEFYLLILPLLFWNNYYQLGQRLTFVVNVGLFIGNIIKDVYELPRPSSPPVWRASNQDSLDSTALKDFGFPSTHSMNAVSNSLLIVWYFWDNNDFNKMILLTSCAFIWMFLLCFSRLYLGVHTSTDIRGGLGLGFIVISVYLLCHSYLDEFLIKTSSFNLFTYSLSFLSILLLLCPQPRPRTPTFHQNSFIAGLLWGLIYGGKVAYEHDLIKQEEIGLLKTIFGFTFTILIRLIIKTFLVLLFEKVFGIQTKPIKNQEDLKKKTKIRLFTREKDIIAIAMIKMLTYFITAFSITFLVPFLWREIQKKIYI